MSTALGLGSTGHSPAQPHGACAVAPCCVLPCPGSPWPEHPWASWPQRRAGRSGESGGTLGTPAHGPGPPLARAHRASPPQVTPALPLQQPGDRWPHRQEWPKGDVTALLFVCLSICLAGWLYRGCSCRLCPFSAQLPSLCPDCCAFPCLGRPRRARGEGGAGPSGHPGAAGAARQGGSVGQGAVGHCGPEHSGAAREQGDAGDLCLSLLAGAH